MRVFVQDPEPYLMEQHLTVFDPLEPARPALLDGAHRSFVNYEVFLFSGDDTKRRFDADPMRWCGILTDPVTRERFRPAPQAPRRERDGRVFFFASQTSAEAFDAMPDMYVLPDYRMLPAPAGAPTASETAPTG